MLEQAEPDGYVIATDEMHSVREFLRLYLDWNKYVFIEFEALCGEAS